jgi:perosamine synthetase
MSYFKPVSISLSPNVEKDDIHLALNLLIRPWLWKKGRAINEIEEQFKDYLGVKYAVSFNSGRSSFLAILKALNLEKTSEILLQAFTCNAVPNPIIWAEFNPVYVDCDKDSFNISANDLRAKITSKSRAVIIQHTFGLPANIDEISSICEDNKLILIEDCAHSLGAEFNGQKTGTFGKASFFSFSRDKVISSVYGGMAVTNDDIIAKKLEKLQKEYGQPSFFWIFQQLLHPILFAYIILPIYNFFDLGKIFLLLSQWLKLLSKAVTKKEKRGQKPDYFPNAFPNALALLALNQFKKLDKFYQHRCKVSKFYFVNLKCTDFEFSNDLSSENLSTRNIKHSFLRFTIKHRNAHEIMYKLWAKENILIGDWYLKVLAPLDTNLEAMKYRMDSCPNAEALSKITMNLPTHINISQRNAERIVNFLKKFK